MKIMVEVIKSKMYIYGVVLLIIFLGLIIFPINNVNKSMLEVKFIPKFDNSIIIELSNNSKHTLYYYDSLLPEQRHSIPSFLWVQLCEKQFENKCNDEKWISPHFYDSSLITTPVELSKLNEGDSIQKEIKYIDIFNKLNHSIKDKDLIKINIYIYEDSSLNTYKSFESNWFNLKQ